MQQNAASPELSTSKNEAVRHRGFWLAVQPSLLSFSVSNDKSSGDLLSGIKFDLPSKSSIGTQQGNINRSISSATFIKSYSCLSLDVFVVSISSADLKRSAAISNAPTSIDTYGAGPSSEDIAAINNLLRGATHSRADVRENRDPSLPPRLIVVTEDSLFDGMKSSGVPPPPRPP